ncbi:universal stress protein [Paracoccus sp. 11-3]|uniref:Universal stress protein n=1 Tax=Paracoccus amoyensis TaxID=2760093 RepID=A0A926GGJ7_9RHOB|nr:universal stress protein [Paracoccus amoyensis]MBC9246657.1 universal stress protein [Paracoccus amoyensis]
MAYKSILTVLSDLRQLSVLENVGALTRRENGHLSVLCLGVDHSQTGYYFPGGTPYVFQEAMDTAVDEAQELEQKVRQELGPKADLCWSVESAVAQIGGVTNLVGMRARYSDLTILSQPYGQTATGDAEAITEAAMFEGGCPVLVLPDAKVSQEPAKRILIAWNQSSEAMTAVRRAIPLLRQAELVEITVIDPRRSGVEGNDPGAALARLLTRHGVKTEVAIIARTEPTISDQINRRAIDIDAELIVMGAYGHSRFREAILGGATRSMLEKAKVPVFMAR